MDLILTFLIILVPLLQQQEVTVQEPDTLTPGFDVSIPGGDDFFYPDQNEPEPISASLMSGDQKIIYISDRWRFTFVDDLQFADPDYDHSDWEWISTRLMETDLAFRNWDGIAWFRKTLDVSSSLAGKPVALLVDRHLGASEIYLNGEKVLELGLFHADPGRAEVYSHKEPLAIVFPEAGENLIAVRFLNPRYGEARSLNPEHGFRLLLADWVTHQKEYYAFLSVWIGSNLFYIGILLAFSIIHFLLFIFYPKERRNLYFSLFAAALVVLTWLFYRIELATYTFETFELFRFIAAAEILVLVLAVRFTHSIDRDFTPFYANLMFTGGLLLTLLFWFIPVITPLVRELVIALLVIEILRVIFLMGYNRRRGVWVLGVGVFFFLIGLISGVLANVQILDLNAQTVNMMGSGLLILSVSVFLSRDFATTQKNLEKRLEEVKELSERALRQEKISKEQEIEKRLLEEANLRKTRELEEARALQISMLPKKLPLVEPFDMAVHMQTATEVGGDYYDYSLDKNGKFVLALGDATGHGLKSGIMVAAAKSYFHTLVHQNDTLTMLRKISQGMRNLNMRLMYMGFMVVEGHGRKLSIASAGMPPAIHYSLTKQKTEQIILKGLPLGGKVNYPYESRNVEMEEGDALLMMSDGLIELFNKDREQLGIGRVEEILLNSAGYSATDIINRLREVAESWTGGSAPDDDITLMVLKIPEK